MINAVDTIWVLISAALVMIMTPGLALFYGGMVGRRNVISTISMSFVMLALIGVLWVVAGYSLSFGESHGGLIGGFDFLFLNGVTGEPSAVYADTVPQLAFMVFQGMFAIIAVALITGAVVERIKFSAVVVFAVFWLLLVYSPVAHWVWGSGGWLGELGAIDFAGGTVVHICAGVSALTLALIVGKRRGYGNKQTIKPHNIPMIMIGAALLWFGWFGFNAGSSLAANEAAANAFVVTNIGAASAALSWMFISWFNRKPSLIGMLTGAVAGLVAVTPAAGFVGPMAAIPIGVGAAAICFYFIEWRTKRGIDETLDVWAVHGMGGTWGAIATGIFAAASVGGVDGLINGEPMQVVKQLVGIVVVWVFAAAATWLIAKAIDKTIGLRVSKEEELVGLDIAQHGEFAYGDN